jgi:glycosyltransferase involved in cell wall biosynthesis
MNILILSPYYYPNINPRPYRWTRIAEQLATQGFDIQVVTEANPNLEETYFSNHVKIHRTGYAALKSIFLKKQRGVPKQNKAENLGKNGIVQRFMQYFNDYLWKKIYFPDDSCIWYFPALRKATQLIENQQIDVIVTVALPFTAHLVGLRLKKQFPHLTWIADTGDPFSYQTEAPLNNHFLYQKLNVYTEKKVLQYADYVTVTTENTKSKYIKFHKPSTEKIVVIPPLMTEVSFVKNVIVESESNKIKLGYLGKFYKILREPRLLTDFLICLFRQFPELSDRVEVHIFGDIFPYFLPELAAFPQIKVHGLIPREATPEAMQKMDILLNISNLTNYQLPSKAPDYLQSGKPIFNIYSDEADEFKAFFNDYPLIFNYKDGDTIQEDCIQFLAQTNKKTIDADWINQKIAPYRVDAITKQYIDLLNIKH